MNSPTSTSSSLLQDLGVIYRLIFNRSRGQNHAERLESFYASQANAYDSFRERLLPGREKLFASLKGELREQHKSWIDMGAGTGRNLEFVGDAIRSFDDIYLVDLSDSLLNIARARVSDKGWQNVEICKADATSFLPPAKQVDLISFSFSLTMIPDWIKALRHAYRLLRPGGLIAVVDFNISKKHQTEDYAAHNWLSRTFWPTYFAFDNVFLSSDHLPYLDNNYSRLYLEESRHRLPYFPGSKVPYYLFIGKKTEEG